MHDLIHHECNKFTALYINNKSLLISRIVWTHSPHWEVQLRKHVDNRHTFRTNYYARCSLSLTTFLIWLVFIILLTRHTARAVDHASPIWKIEKITPINYGTKANRKSRIRNYQSCGFISKYHNTKKSRDGNARAFWTFEGQSAKRPHKSHPPRPPHQGRVQFQKSKFQIFFPASAWRLKSRRNKKRIATAVCKWWDESNEPN